MQEKPDNRKRAENFSRRDFLKASAAVGTATLVSRRAVAKGSDKIRVGLIGCGDRGTGAGIIHCAESSEGVELVAMGDLFQDQMDRARRAIPGNLKKRNLPVDEIYKVTPERIFVGFDAYEKVLACDVDMVILTAPPYFRPKHFRAAVEAGKHVFVEKPIAVDPAGVRSFIETSERARAKGLTVVAGTQMRRARHIMAAMERIHNGDIGEVLGGQCVRCGGAMLNWRRAERKRRPEWSDMEWQIRRWLFVTWLSGDFIVEMHVHNLDLINWAMQSPPVQCMALGGRQVRTAPECGNIFDHCAAEYEYPNGVRIQYLGSQIDGASTRNDIRLVGTKGRGYVDFARMAIEGEKPFQYDGPAPRPVVQEYADMIASIREGKAINEGRQVAESTLTAIMGRMSAYTGQVVTWKWLMEASKSDLSPETVKFGPLPMQPVAVPGVTKLV